MLDHALIIFTKNPELGKVKTRLATSVGDIEALRIYKLLVAHTQKIVRSINVDVIIYYSENIDFNDAWKATNRKIQTNGDLGIKMAEAIKSELNQYKKVCVIGTDCGELDESHLISAFDRLDEFDFVLGPANDGGYYLLGMATFEESIFQGINWSTSEVLFQTKNRISDLNKSYFLLPTLVDVDTLEDWKLVRDKLE